MLDELLEKAHKGDVKAQCALALMYEIGVAGAVDLKQAFVWWTQASSAGDPIARAKVSEYLAKGKGGVRDDAAAADNAKKAEAQGFCAFNAMALSPRQRRQYKILVVSSELVLINALLADLEEAGFRVASASNAPDAMKTCNENLDAAVLILDLHMVGFNGFNILSTARQCNFNQKPKIVMMTKKLSKEELTAGTQLGVDAWLIRPIRKPQLLKTIDAQLVTAS